MRCRRSVVDDQAITFATAPLTLAPTEQAGGFARLTRHWQFFAHLLFRFVGKALAKARPVPKLYVGAIGELLGLFGCFFIVGAFSYFGRTGNVAVSLDKIDAVMRHEVAPDHRRERYRLSVTDAWA